MKRFWLELKSKYTTINNANNAVITIDSDGVEKSHTIPSGTFDPMDLASKVNTVIPAKYGEINDDVKKDLLVLFLEENIVYLKGSFIQYLTNGIEQMDMNNNLVNGAESFLPLYIPEGIETTDVSRNPHWLITRIADEASYVYTNGEEEKEGQLEGLDTLGRLFKVEDKLKDKTLGNYSIEHKNSIDNRLVKTKFAIKTNDGTLIENPYSYDGLINVLDVSTDGRYIYYVSKESTGSSSIMVRDSYTGSIDKIADGFDFTNIKKPIELCKSGVYANKRLVVNYVLNEKFYVVVYNLESKLPLTEATLVHSEAKKERPEFIINKDFTKLIFFDEFYTVLTSQNVENYQIKTTYNVGQLSSSLGNSNGRPYILAVDNEVSKVALYISTSGKHRVVMIELATLTARNFYQSDKYTLKSVNTINQINDNVFIISARIYNRAKGLYVDSIISLNVNWVGYQVIEEVKFITNGNNADESSMYASGLSVDIANKTVYVSILHDSGNKAYFSKAPYPFNESFSELRVDTKLVYPYDNISNKSDKYVRGINVTDNIITYANNKTIYKKIL